MADRYVYAVAVESFFVRAMAGRFDAPARERLREAGIAIDEPFPSVYPAEVFHRCVALAAQLAYPGLGPAQAQFRAGCDHVDGFVQSYPGRMMASLARQIDPRTILEYTATFIRLGNNFTETRARVLGPRHVEVWMNEVGAVPGWYRGIVHRGMEVANVTGVDVRVLEGTPPPGATYAVTWAARG